MQNRAAPVIASAFRGAGKRQALRWLSSLVVLCLVHGSRGAGAHVTVAADKPLQVMTYGMDFERLWYWGSVSNQAACAKLAVVDCPVDYVRVAIRCGAEEQERVFKWELYDETLEMMRAFKKARPDIKFFASPQPLHASTTNKLYTCYPLWVIKYGPDPSQGNRIKFREFKWDKAADYLVNYLTFMKERGFKIHYMDVKNEVRHIRPEPASQMIASVRERVGDDLMPKVVAPSSHNWDVGTKWLEEAIQTGHTHFIDVISTHNTRHNGSLEKFMERARQIGKPVWNTELHRWKGPDHLAVTNQQTLFMHIRAGCSGINDWLSLGSEVKEHKMLRVIEGEVVPMRTYFIFKQLVHTTQGGNYLATNVPEGLTSTMAFIKGDVMTVWLLNADAGASDEIEVQLQDRAVAGASIERMWWGPDNAREGSLDKIKPASPDRFAVKLAPETLSCFTFRIN